MDVFIVADGVKQIGFSGKRLASTTTNPDGTRPRWTELRLWRMAAGHQAPHEEPGGDYMLQSFGMTNVYHKASGGCRKGGPAKLSDLDPLRRVACAECWPRAAVPKLSADAPVRAETDWPQAWQCVSAETLVAVLRELSSRGRTARSVSGLSRPSEQLLEEAADNDPDLADYLDRVEWLTS
jgi:hypothetical protein